MAQIIKIKRGTISSLVNSTPTLQQGELLLATGSVNGLGSTFFVADAANSPELPYAKVESISDGSALASSLDGNFEGLLIHSSSDNKFYRYNGTAFVELPVAAGSFVGTLPVANGGTGQTTYTNGQLLIGNSTGNTLTKATLTAGEGIDITNGNGSITILGENASTTNKGIVELATDNEVSTGSDTSRAITPSSLSVATVATASYVSGSNVDGTVGLASLASSAVNATNAANVDINNTSGDNEFGLVFRTGNTDGNQALYADSEINQPSYNPSTNTITTPIISASSALYVGGNITVTGTVDGRDIATDGSKLDGIEAGADVTDTANVTAAGALMDSEVTDLDGIKSLTVPNNTTISTFGASLVDDTTAAAARTTLGVDAAGTDNSTDVTLAGSYDYITISGQQITRNQIDASTDISNLTTTNVSEGTNKYYTDAKVKTKLNTENVVSGSSQITHDSTTGFVSNEHIDHTSVSITAGDGLSGGGTIASTRTLTLDTGSTHFTEAVEDTIGGMLTGNTETLITVTYQDGDGTIDFVVDNDLSNYSNASTNFITTGASVGGDLSGTIASATVAKVQGVALTSGEATQIANIDSTTISSTQWGYLGVMNQNVRTTDAVTFATIDTGQGATEVYLMNQNVRSSDSPTFAGLTVTGDVSVQGSLTTVNSNEVNIGDRIINLNTANSSGNAGINVYDADAPFTTGSLLYDSTAGYWKAGVLGSETRLVTFDSPTPTDNGFIHLNADEEIVSVAQGSAGSILQSDGDGTFTVTNVIDGGTF